MRLRGPVPLLLASEFAAGLARASLATALGWQAYARANDPLVLGLLGLAEFLPALLLALPAGHVADRSDRRRLAVVASVWSVWFPSIRQVDLPVPDARTALGATAESPTRCSRCRCWRGSTAARVAGGV